MKNLLILLSAVVFLFTSCSKDKDYAALNKAEIEKYIAAKGWTAKSTASGLYYVIDEPGSAQRPVASSTITIHYVGTLTDGTKFDSSRDSGLPFKSALSGLIEGWKEGIPYFGKGGKGKLLLPGSLGYGSSGSGSIPGNAVTIFDIELIDFK
jgi:FKBP-type peptidyl-prolyl cis-trans isomerase FkpA